MATLHSLGAVVVHVSVMVTLTLVTLEDVTPQQGCVYVVSTTPMAIIVTHVKQGSMVWPKMEIAHVSYLYTCT